MATASPYKRAACSSFSDKNNDIETIKVSVGKTAGSARKSSKEGRTKMDVLPNPRFCVSFPTTNKQYATNMKRTNPTNTISLTFAKNTYMNMKY